MVTSAGIDDFVAEPGLTLIELWAAWSGDAFLLGAAVDRLLRRRHDLPLRVGRVDVGAHPDVAARFHGVAPMLLLFRNGVLTDRHVGLITLDSLTAWVEQALGANQPREGES
jgi:thioredoxin-like negative regulator of GroEL